MPHRSHRLNDDHMPLESPPANLSKPAFGNAPSPKSCFAKGNRNTCKRISVVSDEHPTKTKRLWRRIRQAPKDCRFQAKDKIINIFIHLRQNGTKSSPLQYGFAPKWRTNVVHTLKKAPMETLICASLALPDTFERVGFILNNG